MARFFKNREKILGQSPGEMIFVGQQKMDKTRIRLISYQKDSFWETEPENMHQLSLLLKSDRINWVNIDGVHEKETISEIGKDFGISPLVLDDIANTDQRPKCIEEGDNIVAFLKLMIFDADPKSIITEQITLILGPQYLITLQEKTGSFFDPIRERLRNNIGKLRGNGSDYLFYRILDTIADQYSVCIAALGEEIEANEEQILSSDGKAVVQSIYRHKTEISFLRKTIRPVKDISKFLKNSDSNLISDFSRPFFQDLDDLITHAVETVDIYYTLIGDQLTVFNSNLANRSNEVMKTLTIFAAIFIPLTFIAGIYGTNFEYLPELRWHMGYFLMLGLMFLLAVGMIFYFKRKKWL
ncbi:MAG TPA: magnesium/cobalt transporter CorA [Prolixibacteraceae bacterium]|nr:magnesium/cobalt transporter CorA [Prolixibacteraceae bacterium]